MRNIILMYYAFTTYTVLSSVITTDPKYRSDYQFSEEIDGWLKLQVVPASFTEALLRCNMEDAVLASPINLKFKEVMQWRVQPLMRPIFTGIHSLLSRGLYTTVEGVPLAAMPISLTDDMLVKLDDKEMCLVMNPGGYMASVNCADSFPFMCYKKSDSVVLNEDCGIYDPGYSKQAQVNSCYKYHQAHASWRQAQMTCAAEGSHLAIINSDDEARAIVGLFGKSADEELTDVTLNSDDEARAIVGLSGKSADEELTNVTLNSDDEARAIVDLFGKSADYADLTPVASVGIFDWGLPMFLTIHGETLKKAGYERWGPYQLQNFGRSKYMCGAVSRSGFLHKIDCDDSIYHFVCEIELN